MITRLIMPRTAAAIAEAKNKIQVEIDVCLQKMDQAKSSLARAIKRESEIMVEWEAMTDEQQTEHIRSLSRPTSACAREHAVLEMTIKWVPSQIQRLEEQIAECNARLADYDAMWESHVASRWSTRIRRLFRM